MSATVEEAPARRRAVVFLERVPWLWHDAVVRRVPILLSAAGVFAVFLVLGVITAFAAGGLGRFMRDMNWLSFMALPAFSSIAMGYAPRAVERLWPGLRPWLDLTDEEFEDLKRQCRRSLVRYFWVGALLWGGLTLAYSLQDPRANDWTSAYPDPMPFRFLIFAAFPFFGYFIGGANVLAVAGVAMFVSRLSQLARLNPSFVLEGGKRSLHPFNQLVFVTWGTVTIPFLVFIVGQAGNSTAEFDVLDLAMTLVVVTTLLITILVPQALMGRLLARAKAEALTRLREEINDAGRLPPGATVDEVLRRMHRHQHLVYQVQQSEAFRATLVDLRFLIQVGTALAALVVGNGLIPIMFAQLG